MNTSITRRGERGLGRTAAGGNDGSFAGYQRAAAASPGIGISTRIEHLTEETEANLHAELSDAIPEFGDALQAPDGSFPREAADTATIWRKRGEPIEVVKQMFDHDRLHYLPTDFGPARRRRRCHTCGEFVEKGSGVEYGPSKDRVLSAHDECKPKEFRPPRPEPTIMDGEITVTDLGSGEDPRSFSVEIIPGGRMGMQPYMVTVKADTAAKALAAANKSAPKLSNIGTVTRLG